MKTICYVAVCCLAVLPAVAAPKPVPKATNKTKIVGMWELVKAEDKTPPGTTTVEFTKDGKLKVTASVGGTEFNLGGTYTLDGDKLKLTIKGPDGKEKSETDTITKLTDKELHLKDDKGKAAEFKRKK